ncbi:dephospho-CoA kinase [Clostridia bacterium]|nr:dephospho-CoA kinase [Clostridia bacterium]
MLIIGLAGGSGAGKGEVSRMFLAHGIESVDTDQVSREITKRGSDCLRELAEVFTGAILTPFGELDRRRLAEIAFASEEKTALLNSITHKHILNDVRRFITDRERADRKAVIVDAPLLYESGFNGSCDIVIAVVADPAIRIKRVTARDNITEEMAELRLSRQISDEELQRRADYVINNSSDFDALREQVDSVYNKIQREYFHVSNR